VSRGCRHGPIVRPGAPSSGTCRSSGTEIREVQTMIVIRHEEPLAGTGRPPDNTYGAAGCAPGPSVGSDHGRSPVHLRRVFWVVVCVLLQLITPAGPAAAQGRLYWLGFAAGVGAVQPRRVGVGEWDVGPMLGLRALWAAERSRFGLGVVLDVQPFRATGDSGSQYRAGYLMPVLELGSEILRLTGGIGVAYLRFDVPNLDGRSSWVSYSAVGGSAGLSRSLGLQVIWRRTGFTAGFRSHVWSVQVVHLLQL
jgi:hypothetical protein